MNYLYNFGVEHSPKKKLKIHKKTKISKIYRIQAYDSMCGYFCIEFIDFMLKGKSLLDYTNLFYPNEYEINEQITLKYSQQQKGWDEKKSIAYGGRYGP